MAVEEGGRIHETVGGGGGERVVIDAALRALRSDRRETVLLEMSGEASGGGGMVCGGSMEVLVEPLSPERDADWVRALVHLRERGTSALLLRALDGWAAAGSAVAAVFTGDGTAAWTREGLTLPDLPTAPEDPPIAPLPSSSDGHMYLLESVPPVERLIIVGGGHIGKALCEVGALLRFEVTVVDEREEFSDPARFPGAVHVLRGDPGELLASIPGGMHLHYVLVSHGYPSDVKALGALAGKEARYIGMIGSRRRVEVVRRALLEKGLEPADLDRVFAPIGLDIGSETPEEIAVAIAAEIIAVRAGRAGRAAFLSRGRSTG